MQNKRVGVTIARNAGAAAQVIGRQWAEQLGVPYFDRPQNSPVASLLKEQQLTALIVVEKDGPRIHGDGGTFAYHPGMAVLRLQQLKRGGKEHLPAALALHDGSRVLDCTLGLAADAAIAAYCVGEKGRVVGVEASSLVHFAVNYGLANYVADDADLTTALRRIEAVCSTAEDYLRKCAPDSFDVVYFDPMFRNPVQGSDGMRALRPFSYEQPLSRTAVKLALEVAPRVVIKERNEYILRGYGCHEFIGGRYSRVKYGIITRTESNL